MIMANEYKLSYTAQEIDEKLGQISTPDWEQNDPQGEGYIKNKPFGIESTGIKTFDNLIDNEPHTYNENMKLYLGHSYKVTFTLNDDSEIPVEIIATDGSSVGCPVSEAQVLMYTSGETLFALVTNSFINSDQDWEFNTETLTIISSGIKSVTIETINKKMIDHCYIIDDNNRTGTIRKSQIGSGFKLPEEYGSEYGYIYGTYSDDKYLYYLITFVSYNSEDIIAIIDPNDLDNIVDYYKIGKTDYEGLVGLHNNLYIISHDSSNNVSLKIFNTKSREITTIENEDIINADLLPERAAPICIKNNKIYIFAADDNQDDLSNVFTLDIISHNVEKILSNGPTLDIGESSAAVGDKVYFLGGYDTDDDPIKRILVYDITTNSFETLSTELYVGVYSTNAAVIGDTIIIAGGCTTGKSSGDVDTIQEYNTKTNTVTVPDLECHSNNAYSVVSCNNILYLYDTTINNGNYGLKEIQAIEYQFDCSVLDMMPTLDIAENPTNTKLPTAKAVADYIDTVADYITSEVSREIEDVKNLIPEQVQVNFDENDSTSKAYIQNRPFYSIKDAISVTETFYDSLNGDPTVDYVEREEFDSLQAVLTPSTSVQQQFKEGAEITYTLELLYDLSGDGSVGSDTHTGIVQKYSDDLLYVGDAWLVDQTHPAQSEPWYCITYNINTNEITIYVYTIRFGAYSGANVTLSSTYVADEVKQLDSKYIPDYVSRTDMMAYVAEQIALLKAELQGT